MRANTEQEFWARVPISTDGCWNWQGQKHSSGRYGAIWWRGKLEFAHRIAFRLTKGPIPLGAEVMHECDNGMCVPGHLALGTHARNMRDASLRGRLSRKPNAKLSDAQVVEIRRRSAAGETNVALGREFGVHNSAISRAVRGEHYRIIAARTDVEPVDDEPGYGVTVSPV